jgi:hypothetical protein
MKVKIANERLVLLNEVTASPCCCRLGERCPKIVVKQCAVALRKCDNAAMAKNYGTHVIKLCPPVSGNQERGAGGAPSFEVGMSLSCVGEPVALVDRHFDDAALHHCEQFVGARVHLGVVA